MFRVGPDVGRTTSFELVLGSFHVGLCVCVSVNVYVTHTRTYSHINIYIYIYTYTCIHGSTYGEADWSLN